MKSFHLMLKFNGLLRRGFIHFDRILVAEHCHPIGWNFGARGCFISVYKNHHIPPYSSLLPLPGPSLLHHYSTLPYSTPTPLYSILYRYCTRLYTPPLLHSTLLYRYSTLAYLLNRNCTLLYSTPTATAPWRAPQLRTLHTHTIYCCPHPTVSPSCPPARCRSVSESRTYLQLPVFGATGADHAQVGSPAHCASLTARGLQLPRPSAWSSKPRSACRLRTPRWRALGWRCCQPCDLGRLYTAAMARWQPWRL